jgi:hypothetical protein
LPPGPVPLSRKRADISFVPHLFKDRYAVQCAAELSQNTPEENSLIHKPYARDAYRTYRTIGVVSRKAARDDRVEAAPTSDIQKNLYGCGFDLTLSDNSHFTGQLLLLTQNSDAARASTNEWSRTKCPWRSDEDDMRTVTGGGVESE